VDYEAMSGGELQKECARRGLPSSRAAKAIMVKRLTDHDAEQGNAESTEVPRAADVAAQIVQDIQAASPAPHVRVFQQTFPAERGGPDEETHLAYRQATLQAAADAGHHTRGDARLAATVAGGWVYEVSVRRVT